MVVSPEVLSARTWTISRSKKTRRVRCVAAIDCLTTEVPRTTARRQYLLKRTGDSQQLSCGGLQPSQTALRSLTFNLPAGDYQMSLVINGQGPISLGNVIINDCD
jgi:hypothetical protein